MLQSSLAASKLSVVVGRCNYPPRVSSRAVAAAGPGSTRNGPSPSPQCQSYRALLPALRRGAPACFATADPSRGVGSSAPEVEEEASTFVNLNSQGPFGPESLLLIGFEGEGVKAVRKALDEMGAEFLRVVACSTEMLALPLGVALSRDQVDPSLVPAHDGSRIAVLSGISAEEVRTACRSTFLLARGEKGRKGCPWGPYRKGKDDRAARGTVYDLIHSTILFKRATPSPLPPLSSSPPFRCRR